MSFQNVKQLSTYSLILACTVSWPALAIHTVLSPQDEMARDTPTGQGLKRNIRDLKANPSKKLESLTMDFRGLTSVWLFDEDDIEIDQAVRNLGNRVPRQDEINQGHTKANFKKPILAATWRQTLGKLKNDPQIGNKVEAQLQSSKVYDYCPFNFSTHAPLYPQTTVTLEDSDTLSTFIKYKALGNNPVGLNFANRNDPLGGLFDGAAAQEETLGRMTDLFPATTILAKERAYPFPELGGIYIPKINILRDNKYNFLQQPVEAAIIFSAAYRCDGRGKDDRPRHQKAYYSGTKKKVDSQFQMAILHGHDVFIAGAWGCGAFKNDVNMIANIYLKKAQKYAGYFKKIIFAIPGGATAVNQPFNILSNQTFLPGRFGPPPLQARMPQVQQIPLPQVQQIPLPQVQQIPLPQVQQVPSHPSAAPWQPIAQLVKPMETLFDKPASALNPADIDLISKTIAQIPEENRHLLEQWGSDIQITKQHIHLDLLHGGTKHSVFGKRLLGIIDYPSPVIQPAPAPKPAAAAVPKPAPAAAHKPVPAAASKPAPAAAHKPVPAAASKPALKPKPALTTKPAPKPAAVLKPKPKPASKPAPKPKPAPAGGQ
jgi:uncharacterized protein (TIGR02452 family)